MYKRQAIDSQHLMGPQPGQGHLELVVEGVDAALVGRALAVSYTHLRAHETVLDLVCRLLLEKKKYIVHIHYFQRLSSQQMCSTPKTRRLTQYSERCE